MKTSGCVYLCGRLESCQPRVTLPDVEDLDTGLRIEGAGGTRVDVIVDGSITSTGRTPPRIHRSLSCRPFGGPGAPGSKGRTVRASSVVRGLLVGGETNAKQGRLDPSDFAPEGYSLFNAGIGADLKVGGRPLGIEVSLRNVFDQEYANFLSRYKRYALNPGRNLTVRASIGM
jgi:hypothetical protein